MKSLLARSALGRAIPSLSFFRAFNSEELPLTNRVLLSNLPYHAHEEEVKSFISQYGNALKTKILIRQDGVPQGRAVVEFGTIEEAASVAAAASEQTFTCGNTSRKVFMRHLPERTEEHSRPARDYSEDTVRIVMEGNQSASVQELRQFLQSQDVNVRFINFLQDKNFCFARLASFSDVEAALKLDNAFFNGASIKIQRSFKRPERRDDRRDERREERRDERRDDDESN